MEHGNDNPSSQHEDSNFNLYDAYGTNMDDTSTGGFGAIGGGWDHHDHSVVDDDEVNLVSYHDTTTTTTTTSGGYDNSTTPMDDFDTTHYGHEFQHGQPFHHDDHQFQDFMVHNDHHQHTGHMGGFVDLNSMDLYNTSSIYPNLAQENTEYGRSSSFYII